MASGLTPFDLGIVSFPTVVLAGCLGLRAVDSPSEGRSKAYLVTTCLGHGFVSFNYGLGALAWNESSAMGPSGFRAYCVVFFLLWAGAGAVAARNAQQFKRRAIELDTVSAYDPVTMS